MKAQEAIEKLREFCKLRAFCELYPDACKKDDCEIYMAIEALSEPSQPYTESEIQTMQDLEQAQLDKAYELGRKEGREALEKDAIDALETVGYDFSDSELSAIELEEVCEAVGDVRQDMINRIKRLTSTQPDNRIAKIADLVEGTIDHYELDDAMDLIYQIKEILKNG